MKRLLTCDGGGVRGALSAGLLERLDALSPGCVGGAELIAGTSTGAILAVALAAGVPPARIRALYELRAAAIFSRPLLWRLRSIGGLYAPRFPSDELRGALLEVLGQARLGDLGRTVLVASFDLERWRPKVWESDCPSDAGELAVDVVLRSAAAPIYFAPWKGHCDGGVFANDPTGIAVVHALKRGGRLSDLAVLSVGTGRGPRSVSPPLGRRAGLRNWLPHLPSLLIDSPAVNVEREAREILGNRYHRIQPALTEDVDLADASAVPSLLAAARAYPLESTEAWLRGVGWTSG